MRAPHDPTTSGLAWRTAPIVAAAACALWAGGCVGTEVGNPQDDSASVEFDGYERTDARALTLESGLVIDRAWVAVESLELREASRCDGPDALVLEGPLAAELTSGQELPAPPTLERPATTYCKIKLRLGALAAPVDGAPAELDEAAIFITGARADATPFELRAPIQEVYVLVSPQGGIEFAPGQEALVVGVSLNDWVTPALLEDLAPDADGVIRIDQDHNQPTLAEFKRNVRRGFHLFRDRDRDGRVNPASDALLAAGELGPDGRPDPAPSPEDTPAEDRRSR